MSQRLNTAIILKIDVEMVDLAMIDVFTEGNIYKVVCFPRQREYNVSELVTKLKERGSFFMRLNFGILLVFFLLSGGLGMRC